MKKIRPLIASILAILLTLSALSFEKANAATGVVDFGPYLYDLQSDSVYVMATTSAASDTLSITLKDSNGNVINTFSTNSGVLNTMNKQEYAYSARYTYKLLISPLTPNTTYKYDSSLDGQVTTDNTFKTPPAVGDQSTAFKFGVWGDTQDVPLAGVAASEIAKTSPLAMLHVGDMVNEGKNPAQYSKYLFGPAASLLRDTSIIPSNGNHDCGVSYLNEIFPTPRTNTSSNAGNLYYTYDIGDVHFVVINLWYGLDWEYSPVLHLYDANKSPVSGDVARVKRMLEEDAASPAATSAKYRIITMHSPQYDIYGPDWNALVPYLKKYDPSMIFFGHTHTYQAGTIQNTDFKYIVTGLIWDGQTYTSAAPSFVEATANYFDTLSNKNVLKLTPHVWAGNDTASSDTFTGRPGDILVNPPVISDTPQVSATDTSATITWTSDVNTDDRVDYGTDRYLNNTPVIQSNDSTAHTVTLSNLTPGTQYSYRVKGKGKNGDIGRTDILTFKTTGTAPVTDPPTPTPVITETPPPTPIPTPVPGENILTFKGLYYGDGVNKFTFSNGTQGSGSTNWSYGNTGNIYNDNGHSDAYVAYKFEGTKAKVYAETGPACGIAAISILDENNTVEVPEQLVDLYGVSDVNQNLVYVSQDLPAGIHTIKIRDAGYTSSSSSKYWTINIFKIGVLGGPTPTPKPTATPTVTSIPTVSPTPQVTFTDLGNYAWASDYIYSLVAKSAVSGYPDGTYRPGNNIRRDEFAKMITSAFSIVDESAVTTFSDVATSAWYYKYVASLQKTGLSVGNPDGTYAPGSYITREEMFTINARAINKYYGIEILSNDDPQTADTLSKFVDGGQVSDWAKGYVATNAYHAIIQGTTVPGGRALFPRNPITRAEVAIVLCNSLDIT